MRHWRIGLILVLSVLSQAQNTYNSVLEKGAISNGVATVREEEKSRETKLPPSYFVGFGFSPASLQMMMVRYWQSHHRPLYFPILRADARADAAPVHISLVGHDILKVNGKS